MSRISRTLSRLAAAQRVSMEDANEAVQGQDGELNEQELAEVAKKAEATVDAEAADAAGADQTAPGGDETVSDEPPAAGGDEEAAPADDAAPASDAPADSADAPATDAPAEGAPAGDEPPVDGGDVPADDAAPADAPAGDESPAAEEAPAEEIETPAESELSDLSQNAEDPAVAEQADAALNEEGAGDEAGLDSTDGDASVSDEPPAGDDAAADVAVDDAAPADVPGDAGAEEAAPIDEAAPAVDEAAAPVDGEGDGEGEEAAPAAAPGPKTDTSETVQEVVQLTEALAEAGSAEEVVKQARELSDGLTEVVDTAEVINENGGPSMESFAMLELALRPHLKLLARSGANLGVSLESYAGKRAGVRQQISLEEIKDIIAELDVAQPQLERQAIESLDRVVDALNDALPTAADRLKAVISAANHSGDREGGEVKIDDGLSTALQINGAFPEDLSNDLQNYATLGRCLLGNYSEVAFRSAKAASLMTNAVDFTSGLAFWEKVGKIVEVATDPRCTLTRTQLEGSLPGGVSLFGEATAELDANNQVLQKLLEFNTCYAPLEALVANKTDVGAATAPALSASKIVLVGKALLEVIDCEAVKTRLSEGQKLWPEAQDSIRHLRENLANAPREIELDSGADFTQLVKFVETQYALATWPLVNYLTNFVLTVNAFVLFAERSLKAEEAPPADAVQIDPAADVVQQDDAPAADAAVDDAAAPPADLEVSQEDNGTAYAVGKMQALHAQVAELQEQLTKLKRENAALKKAKK